MRNRPQEVVDPEDRVYWMRRWLGDNQGRINDIKKGRVTFDFAGRKLVAKLEAFEEVQQKI